MKHFTPARHQYLVYMYIPIIMVLLWWSLVVRLGRAQAAFYSLRDEEISNWQVQINDKRTRVLGEFLRQKKSPLAGYEMVFIKVADKYGLPWSLLPAIAGKESSYGKRVPYYRGRFSYNPFGWGVTGGRVIAFRSWSEAIDAVGFGLKKRYFDKGITSLEDIEKYYTPPSYRTNHHWLRDVEYLSLDLEERLRLAELVYGGKVLGYANNQQYQGR
ncbi:MAG: glucosaminidase domain-containing protein [bacterium]|nr:glucosaminidase domain-containing protein [bacterium]